MTPRLLIIVLAVLAVSAGRLSAAESAAAPGFSRTRQEEGHWWLIDPQGRPFMSNCVAIVLSDQDYIQGTKISPYADTVKANYVDSASAPKLHTPDVSDPEFEKLCRARAIKLCAPAKDDTQLLGWFTDNELRWGADELLVVFLNLPASAPGRAAAFALLRSRYPDVAAFNAFWRTSFSSWAEAEKIARPETPPDATRPVLAAQNIRMERTAAIGAVRAYIADYDAFAALHAGRYFQIASDAIRTTDPHHLILGCRFAIIPPAPVIAAAVPHIDVISINCYDPRGPAHALDAYAPFPRPVIIGKFSYRGRDSGLPNTKGASPIVETQEQRTQGFEDYVTAGLRRPNLVGYHWFEHADETKEGRFDGEGSNYGLLNFHDEHCASLIARMASVNAQADAIHKSLPLAVQAKS
ncbi:MAG: agarase [Burkholderiales bacterium]|nr:agarase [Opitutaceae bacterium]